MKRDPMSPQREFERMNMADALDAARAAQDVAGRDGTGHRSVDGYCIEDGCTVHATNPQPVTPPPDALRLATAFIHIRGAHNPTADELDGDQEVRPCAWCRLAGEQAAEALAALRAQGVVQSPETFTVAELAAAFQRVEAFRETRPDGSALQVGLAQGLTDALDIIVAALHERHPSYQLSREYLLSTPVDESRDPVDGTA